MAVRVVGVVCVSMMLAVPAVAQERPRIEVGPAVRADHVRVEGGLTCVTTVAGVSVGIHVRKALSVEGEVTRAAGTLARHYTGWFVSFAPPGSTPEEIERLAPIARRDLGYEPGWGGAAALVWRAVVGPRVEVGARLGVSGRRYVETSRYTMLSIPPEVDEARAREAFIDSRDIVSRGGALFGVDVPVRVTRHLRVIPEVRVVLGPRQVGNAHREWSVGVRGAWAF